MTIDNSFQKPKDDKIFCFEPPLQRAVNRLPHNSVTDPTPGFDEIVLHVSAYNSFYIQLKFFVIWAVPCEASTQCSPDNN